MGLESKTIGIAIGVIFFVLILSTVVAQTKKNSQATLEVLNSEEKFKMENDFSKIEIELGSENYKDSYELAKEFYTEYKNKDTFMDTSGKDLKYDAKYLMFYSLIKQNKYDKAFSELKIYVKDIKKKEPDAWERFYEELDGMNSLFYSVMAKRVTITETDYWNMYTSNSDFIRFYNVDIENNYPNQKLNLTMELVSMIGKGLFGCSFVDNLKYRKLIVENYYLNSINRNEYYSLQDKLETECDIDITDIMIKQFKSSYSNAVCYAKSNSDFIRVKKIIDDLTSDPSLIFGGRHNINKEKLTIRPNCCNNKELIFPQGIMIGREYSGSKTLTKINLCSLNKGVLKETFVTQGEDGFKDDLRLLINSVCDSNYNIDESQVIYGFLLEVGALDIKPSCCDNNLPVQIVISQEENNQKVYDFCSSKIKDIQDIGEI